MRIIMSLRDFTKKYFFFLIYFIEAIEFFFAFCKFVFYSGIFIYPIRKEKLLGRIIEGYHSIERSMSLPKVRLGFGLKLISQQIELNNLYIKKFGFSSTQIVHSIEVINEYQLFHKKKNFEINGRLNKKIEYQKLTSGITSHSEQISSTPQLYFENKESSFIDFSNSRKSVRRYSNKIIDNEIVFKAFSLSQNAPSACNRQGARIHFIENKDIIKYLLSVHVGTAGFKEGINSLIVLTEDLEVSNSVFEKNQVYVDGGIYTMNLLYALHFYGIATCPLNCSFSIIQEYKIRKKLGLKKSECFISFISIGYPADELILTTSKKKDLSEILSIHK
jgi:nitroreductase